MKQVLIRTLLLLNWMAWVGCNQTTQPQASPLNSPATENLSPYTKPCKFSNVTPHSGITFVHNNGASGKYYLNEAMTGGLALFDFDLDRLTDIFFCTGKHVDQAATNDADSPVFFRNQGGLKFSDITLASAAASKYYCLGATVGDYDNDGFPDLYLSNFGPNQLLHNNGDGTFEDVTAECNVGNGERFGGGVSFADFNKDGSLDLFVGNYVKLQPADLVTSASRTKYPGPLDFPTETCTLFISDGAGGWTDASAKSGIGRVSSTAMGVVCGDFDDDEDTDIYVANDEMPNSLFLNEDNATFTESAYPFGVAVDAAGRVNGSMGIDVADADNDGLADILVTSFARELVTLYQMTKFGSFKDATYSSHIGDGTAPHVTWGCCFADFDHDGDRDVYIGSGHFDETSEYCRVTDLLFKNLLKESGKLTFREIGKQIGDLGQIAECSRGTAVADLDNDGDLDIVVLNVNAPCTVLRNDTETSGNGNWLKVKLIGSSINRDAVGTKIQVCGSNWLLVDEVRNGRGYQSYWGEWLHFGLEGASLVDVKVKWANGQTSEISGVTANSHLTLIQ